MKFFTKTGVTQKYQIDYEMAFAEVKDDTSFWRMDFQDTGRRPNALNNELGEGSTYSYWSFQNSNLVRYMVLNGLIHDSPSEIRGLNNHIILQSLNGAKYLEKDGIITQNQYVLPLAYLYDHVVDESAYENAGFGLRERLQLTNAITNDEEALNMFPATDFSTFELDCGDIVNEVVVEDPSVPVHFDVDVPADGILYVGIYGLEYDQENNYSTVTTTVECAGEKASWVYLTPEHVYYFGNRDYLFYMGYSDENRQGIDVFFNRTGRYSFDNFSVEFIPYAFFLESIQERHMDVVDNIKINTNLLSIQKTTDKDQILYLSVPYSSGWKLYVDGEHQHLFRTGIMGMGCVLSQGEHNVVLKYVTPGIIDGICVNLIGVLSLIFLWRRKVTGQFGL